MESIVNKILDDLDLQILDILQNGAHLSNSEIAKRINLSPPATHTRIKRLENEGYINRHVVILIEPPTRLKSQDSSVLLDVKTLLKTTKSVRFLLH